jgi:hypothetical protein
MHRPANLSDNSFRKYESMFGPLFRVQAPRYPYKQPVQQDLMITSFSIYLGKSMWLFVVRVNC